MGAVTYPNPEVERYMDERFVPVQFSVVAQPEVMERFNSSWTPTLVVLDADGKEHRRSYGYLDPQRFLGEMALARLQAALNGRELEAAHRLSAEAMPRVKGDPFREPEAMYWSAVAAYKASNDPKNLIEG